MPEKMQDGEERMVVIRVFDVPREVVWKAWTEPEYAMQWWGPHGFTTPVCRIDLRVGGKFLYCMRSPEGQDMWVGGEYHEIVAPERIVFSMYPCDAEGNRVDFAELGVAHEAIEGARDVLLFEDLGDGRTRLTLIGNETMENAKQTGQLEGTYQMIEKLAEVVAKLQGAA